MGDVELFLPEITEDMTEAEIAALDAELLLVIEGKGDKVENKYNPSQPRDKDGQWSDGGGGSLSMNVQKGLLRDEFRGNGAKTLDSEESIGKFIHEYHEGHPGREAMDAAAMWVDASGCRQIQSAIRNKDENYSDAIKSLDTLTNRSSLKSDVNMFRGMAMTQSSVRKMAEEGSFKSKTFFTMGMNAKRVEDHFAGYSAGYDDEAKDFRHPTMFRIKAKSGTKGTFLDSRYPDPGFHNGLGEFLPSRETSYKVTDVQLLTYSNGDYAGAVVDMETQ